MGEVIDFLQKKADGTPFAGAPCRPKFGTISIILLPDGSHQYVRDGAYASSRNLTIQALSEVVADLATKGLTSE